MTWRLVLSGLLTHFLMFWEKKICAKHWETYLIFKGPLLQKAFIITVRQLVPLSRRPGRHQQQQQSHKPPLWWLKVSQSREVARLTYQMAQKKRCKPPRRWLVKADRWACLGVTGGSRWTSGDVRFQHGNHLSFTFWGKTGFQATTNQLQEFPLSQFFSFID